LALIEGGPQARAPALAGVRAALGALFYVTPRRIDRLESTLGNGGFAGTTMILVVPAGAGGRVRPSFTVAGCVGFTMRFGRHESIEREAA
jgi:hypothetical protein